MLYFIVSFNFLFLYFLIWVGTKSEAVPTYLYHNCTNTTTFTPNSVYQTNLNQLLSFLSSNSTREFYKATAGQNPSSSVHGLFLCRGDINSTACRDCVTTATKDALDKCPVEKDNIIWYDECQLRYSNRSFLGTMDVRPRIALINTANITFPVSFNNILNATMRTAIAEAASGDQKKFATKDAYFTEFDMVYCLVQCTPDLSAADCSRCLKTAIDRLHRFSDKQGARVLFPSCNVRYELYPFYNEYVSPSPSNQPAPSSPPGSVTRPKGNSSMSTSTITASVIGLTAVSSLALSVTGYCLLRHRRARNKNQITLGGTGNKELIHVGTGGSINFGENEITTIESLQFDLATVETATKKFSECYKLGEGGFGEVYKGILRDGQEIAVKRLSKTSGQGAEEFKNEVVLVAKLQHRNLVRLLGFCLDGGEKMLVYEFVTNKSLDYFLFDPKKRGELDWSTRHKIIEGIARGILYLHEDSRLRVIHRDLKASNVLLDADMNPKVSDFGMARMFGIDQTQGNTKRIVGTYGYMAPEYAMEGFYSIKSDVFSFGVLLLEILNGKRNNSFHLTGYAPSLVAYAWQLWNEGKGTELMDPLMKDSCPPSQILRYVHIGLLCVQEDANKRPTMSAVVLMLKSESLTLPRPQRPAFFVGRFTELLEIGSDIYSINTMAVSDFVPR